MFDIYGKQSCRYCDAAKTLLESKELMYTYFDVDEDLDKRQMLKDKGFSTVPQIYLGDKHIGGYDDLVAYFEKGVL